MQNIYSHVNTNKHLLSNKQWKYKVYFITPKLLTACLLLLPFPLLSFVFSALLSAETASPTFPRTASSPFNAVDKSQRNVWEPQRSPD